MNRQLNVRLLRTITRSTPVYESKILNLRTNLTYGYMSSAEKDRRQDTEMGRNQLVSGSLDGPR